MHSFAFRDFLLGCLAHVRCGRADDPKRRGEVNVDHRVPLLVGHVLYDRVPGIARVVDDDIDAAERLGAGLYQPIRKLNVRDAARSYDSLAALRVDLISGSLCDLRIYIVDNHGSAVLGEELSYAAANPATRSGND